MDPAPNPARNIHLTLEKKVVHNKMTKFLSKWLRKIHRWIAVPTALAIPTAFVIKLLGDPEVAMFWAKLEKIPSILMLVMALTGAYLFLLPYIVRGQRKKRNHQPKGSTSRQQLKRGKA